jgi:hypothetical protein
MGPSRDDPAPGPAVTTSAGETTAAAAANGEDRAPPWTEELAAFSAALPNAGGGRSEGDAVRLVVALLRDSRLHWAVARAFVMLLRGGRRGRTSGAVARAVQQSILRRAGAEGGVDRDVVIGVAGASPQRAGSAASIKPSTVALDEADLDLEDLEFDDLDDDETPAISSPAPRSRRRAAHGRSAPAQDPLADALKAVERLRRIRL